MCRLHSRAVAPDAALNTLHLCVRLEVGRCGGWAGERLFSRSERRAEVDF